MINTSKVFESNEKSLVQQINTLERQKKLLFESEITEIAKAEQLSYQVEQLNKENKDLRLKIQTLEKKIETIEAEVKNSSFDQVLKEKKEQSPINDLLLEENKKLKDTNNLLQLQLKEQQNKKDASDSKTLTSFIIAKTFEEEQDIILKCIETELQELKSFINAKLINASKSDSQIYFTVQALINNTPIQIDLKPFFFKPLYNYWSVLHIVAAFSCQEFFETYIKDKFTRLKLQTAAQYANVFGSTALHLAALYGSKKMILHMLEIGSSIYSKDTRGNSFFHYLNFRQTPLSNQDIYDICTEIQQIYPNWTFKDVSLEFNICRQKPVLPESIFSAISEKELQDIPISSYITENHSDEPQLVVIDCWHNLTQLHTTCRDPYVTYLTQGYTSHDGQNKQRSILPNSSENQENSKSYIKKIFQNSLPLLLYNIESLSNDSPAFLNYLQLLNTLDLSKHEIEKGIWIDKIIFYTAKGLTRCHIPYMKTDPAAASVFQLLVLTCKRLIFIKLNSSGDYISIDLKYIEKAVIMKYSSCLCILTEYMYGDQLIELTNLNAFIQILCVRKAEISNIEDCLSNASGIHENVKAFVSREEFIIYKLDRTVGLINGKQKRVALLSFTDFDKFMIYQFNPSSLLITLPNIIHLNFAQLCVNPSKELITLSNSSSTDNFKLVKSSFIWKEFFLVLTSDGVLKFLLHPNDKNICFEIPVMHIKQWRLFSGILFNSIEQIMAIDLNEGSDPPILLMYSSMSLDYKRWIEVFSYLKNS